nr:MAG TPA: hypothetical protein [Caudoviricetes sp.]
MIQFLYRQGNGCPLALSCTISNGNGCPLADRYVKERINKQLSFDMRLGGNSAES